MASIKMTLDVEAVKDWLEKADMVAVVRCRDCKHWYPEEVDGYEHCRKHDLWALGGWFCADGERREK